MYSKRARQLILVAVLAALLSIPWRDVVAADPNYQGPYDITFDETTKQELQQWAFIYWEYHDTGIVPPGAGDFEFSNPDQFPPGFHPFNSAFDHFTELYADQLNLDVFSEDYYDIYNLLEDNPSILQEFKVYTLSGEYLFQSGRVVSPEERFRRPDADPHKSSNMQNKMAIPMKPSPPPEHIPLHLMKFDSELRKRVEGSKLSDVPYVKDPLFPWQPGAFDCDDSADAMAGWLLNKLLAKYPGMKVYIISLRWGTLYHVGHRMVVVEYDGYYWIIDPQTGEILGPYKVGTPINPREILENRYGLPPDASLKLQGRSEPGDRPFVEPGPWWESPEMQEHLEDATGNDWEDYVPPGCMPERFGFMNGYR